MRSFPRRLALSLAASALLVLDGCAATPPLDLPLPKDARVTELLGDYVHFERSPKNRYAVVLKGQEFAPPDHPFRIGTSDDVKREGIPIADAFVANDVDQIVRLLASKGYDVYRADMGEVSPADVDALLERIAIVSDDDTRLFFAYSGEGDRNGLRTRTLAISDGRRLIPPDATIHPAGLVSKVAQVKGTTTILLNACESGIFAEEARRQPGFRGVVIAACAIGTATTPHEPTATSSIYAAFLGLYRDDPKTVKNLGAVKIDKAGGTFTNLAHRWSDFWGGAGLPISYEPVVYTNADFMF